MQLAIPRAPRPVKLRQVPGAVRRLALVAAFGVALCGAIGAGAFYTGQRFGQERRFLQVAQQVEGTVARVALPPREEREQGTARMDVLYAYAEEQRSVSGVITHALYAEGLGPGAKVALLVDPSHPDRPREARYEQGRHGVLWLVPAAIAVGALLALALFGVELLRTVRGELAPLRTGALVWLTPEGPLPDHRREIVFSGSYFREDVKYTVRARGRPGRSPVRNGDKVLAAVVPKKPTLARLVDEDLARTLGWIRG